MITVLFVFRLVILHMFYCNQ